MRAAAERRMPSRVAASVTLVLAFGLALAGCTEPGAEPTAEPSGPAPSASGSPTPSVPTLIEGGTAEQNLPYFEYVITQFMDSSKKRSGGAFVDALVEAGFERDDIEVTPDTTAIGQPADSVVFAVRLGDTCLIGQHGNGIKFESTTSEVLATGQCLVGTEHPA